MFYCSVVKFLSAAAFRSNSDMLSQFILFVNNFFLFILNFKNERRRRDLNPRAAINDLLPFQGSPFSQLGYFSKVA